MPNSNVSPASTLAWAVAVTLVAAACGTLLTDAPNDADLFDAPLPGLTSSEMEVFLLGDEAFGRAFSVSSARQFLFEA